MKAKDATRKKSVRRAPVALERESDRQEREKYLRQQLTDIQNELGTGSGETPETLDLKSRLGVIKPPRDVARKLARDLSRLERISDTSAEYGLLRKYLETLSDLPWAVADLDEIDIANARAILDKDIYDLKKVKKQILEFLAVEKLNPNGNSPIICFIGPPGVGKTLLSKSIARAMGRKFARLSLDGLHDEARIRGHIMTFTGAMPGNITDTLRRVGARDCVLLLDDIDKLGTANSRQGDPVSALLEVFDPEQNISFRDNYLAVPFDLSRIFFIATASVLWNIPRSLQDRMEVIEIPGYTDEDKLQIARRYLVSQTRAQNGLKSKQCKISAAALKAIIHDYTKEAGVWDLQRVISAVFRHAAVKIAEGQTEQISIRKSDLRGILGPIRFEDEVAMRKGSTGVATGLAWTPVGGEILFIEAAISSGSGRLILTGQLGEVMKESAQAAMTLLKSRAKSLKIDPSLFESHDVHIHVPAGAIPKDGPSAGVTIFCALASIYLGRCVKFDTAMTGEISLRGLVLPVGGIKEKVIAAVRANIKTVLLPARNKKDFAEIPDSAKTALKFIWLETVDDALKAALDCSP